MGLIQNKVTVSQPNSHVVVKNAGGLRGLTGETGPQGPQGVPGQAATVTAGTTTTLPAGSDATVQNVGSTSAAIFNFGIPKGDKGDTGESGAAATISVGTTTTLPAGSSATVTNSGTSSAAVFDFGIPKGAKGDTGATGADGYSPSATVTKTGDTATITITDKDGTTTAQISDGTTPTVNDGTLTIQKNGTTVQTFSADQASNVTANITVPTQFSDLSGTVSSSQIDDEAITTGSVSGTGTNITLAGTMEGGAIESVELNGDTQQTTYSGKNLLNITKGTFTQNGITFTQNPDGSVTMNGTSTGNAYYEMNNTTASQTTVTSGVRYTLSIGDVTLPSGQVIVQIRKVNPNVIYAAVNDKSASFTAPETTTTFTYIGVYGTGVTLNNLTIYPMLEVGSSMTSFEPYVGGTASPNPDYPQEAQTVTGEQTVTVVGKNLCNPSDTKSVFVYTGANRAAYNVGDTSVIIPVLTNTDYTISTLATQARYRGGFSDSIPVSGGGDVTVYNGFNKDSQLVSVTTNSGDHKYLIVNATDFTKIQIEKGSIATSFVPYAVQTYPINLGKNLYEGSPSFDSFSGISAWEDGGTYNDMPVVKRAAAWSGTYRLLNIDAGKTYTFSAWVKSDEARQVAIYAIGSGATATISPNNKTITTSTSWERVSFTFTCLTSGTIALRFENTSASTTNYTYISGYQLELGSTATTYAPYFTPIELCKIGTYQDYIYKSGEDWYVKKNIGKQNMSALSGLSVISTGNFIASGFSSTYGSVIGTMLSNIFTYSDTGWEKVGKFGIAASGNMWAMTGDSTITTANISTWLSNRNAVVYYELSTPTDTQITDATLIAQLEDLLSATTYSGTTYITVSGDLASPLEVVAEADSKLAPDSVYGAAIKDGAVSVDKIADLKALADALAPYLNS